MRKQKRNQENIELELKLEEMNVQKKIQKQEVLCKSFNCKQKKINVYITFYLLLVILKMAYEEIGTRHGYHIICLI